MRFSEKERRSSAKCSAMSVRPFDPPHWVFSDGIIRWERREPDYTVLEPEGPVYALQHHCSPNLPRSPLTHPSCPLGSGLLFLQTTATKSSQPEASPYNQPPSPAGHKHL